MNVPIELVGTNINVLARPRGRSCPRVSFDPQAEADEPVNPTTLHNLGLAAEGEFAYADSDSEALIDLALQDSDPEVATSALGELTQRDSDDARAVAQQILQREPWDHHLSAYALTVLYSRDPDAAFEAMQRMLSASADKSIYQALIEHVLSDRSRYIDGVGRQFAAALAERLTAAVVNQLDGDEVLQFLTLYKS